MKFIRRFFIYYFDRSFSGKSWKQLAWLIGIIIFVFSTILLCSYCLYPLGACENILERIFQLFCIFIDPGSVQTAPESWEWFALLVAVIGLILFCGLLISVMSSMLERRIERFRDGDIDYPLNNHIVIIGFDEMVPALIRQICASTEEKYRKCSILIQSDIPAQEVRSRIHTELESEDEKRVLILHARRNSIEELQKLRTPYAREVFLIGECNEYDHDSLNIDCLKKIVELHKIKKNCPIIPITVLFEYQTTFAAFQTTDIPQEWRQYIEFRPINFYEEWAKKVLVNKIYKNNSETVNYPSLDREAITEDSNKHVHLVIIGMSRMGIALAVEAAQLLHFPNFCRDSKKKSIITFIDENADVEMNFFMRRYRHYFEISSTSYRDMTGEKEIYKEIAPTLFRGENSDFLDIRFEFVKGKAESTLVQNQIEKWSMADDELLSIAVCLNLPPQSMAVGLYLPDKVYERNIPIFIRQETSSALLTMLNSSKKENEYHKYSHVYPFGMLDNCYDLDSQNIFMAQSVHYLYDYYKHHKELPTCLPSKEELQKSWNELSIALQWSNIYNASSMAYKLRSLNATNHQVHLSDENIKLIAQVEHNRWNMEKLLLGYRKPSSNEQELIDADSNLRKEYKNKYLVHTDIRPYEQLSEESKNYDICLNRGIPLIIRNFPIR